MWGRWLTITFGGALVVLLLVGLLFSFAPVVLGLLIAAVVGLAAMLLLAFGRSATAGGGEMTQSGGRPVHPSEESMSAERSPGRSNKPPTAP